MSLFKKRRYYFTDSSFAGDTIIAYCMSAVALIIELAGIIASVASAGHVPEVFGMLYLCAMLLSAVGGVFARFGMKSQKGGVRGKRVSVWMNLVSLLVPVVFLILGALR